MLFENINTTSQPDKKKIEKHIKLDPYLITNLNNIQIAYKVETSQHINLNDLISISINLLIKDLKKEISKGNELKAIEYLTELNQELKQC